MKCSFCEFTAPVWRTLANGKKISDWAKLKEHLWESHPDEAEKLREARAPEDLLDLMEDET